MALQFEDEMKNKLLEYSDICGKIEELTASKNKIREQAKQWIELNKLDEVYTQDPKGQTWKICRSTTTRKKIDDWRLLRELVGSHKDEVFSENESSTFKISKVKGFPVRG